MNEYDSYNSENDRSCTEPEDNCPAPVSPAIPLGSSSDNTPADRNSETSISEEPAASHDSGSAPEGPSDRQDTDSQSGSPSPASDFGSQSVTQSAGSYYGSRSDNPGSGYNSQPVTQTIRPSYGSPSGSQNSGSYYGGQAGPQSSGSYYGNQSGSQGSGSYYGGQSGPQSSGSYYGGPSGPQNSGSYYGNPSGSQNSGYGSQSGAQNSDPGYGNPSAGPEGSQNSHADGAAGSDSGSGGPMMPPKKQKRQRKKGGARRMIAAVLICAIVGGLAGFGGTAAYHAYAKSRNTTVITEMDRPKVETVVNTENGQPMTPEQLYAANLPTCVGITVSTTVNIYGRTTTSAASGSGFILSEDGYIATNYHVIEEAVENDGVDIEVTLSNDEKYTATLVGGEKDNDVAVLKIDATGLTPVTLGDSDQLVVGEAVYTIGNPLGELTFTFTDGMVSALDRLITTTSQENGQNVETTLNVLQTNCAINPGNSGGPLFDSYGNVIGITTAKYTQSSSGVSAEGLGFALPINDIKNILADLIQHGYVTGKPYLGIQVSNVTEEIQRYGIPAGCVVEYVAEGSCAQKAGLQVNDIITAIDDTAIDSSTALTAALAADYKAGDTVSLTIYRQQQEMKIQVTLDEKNEQTEANNQQQQTQTQQPQQQQPNGSYGNGWEDFFGWPFGGFNW